MKLVATPKLAHQYQVVRDDGLPDVRLTRFAVELLIPQLPPSMMNTCEARHGTQTWVLRYTCVWLACDQT